tara:strand:+ start:549 stop:1007 length:459 start_codon:yes stop_codon:yes gene_type:complete
MINIYSKWFGFSILAIFFVCIVDLGRKYVLDKNMINVDEMIIYLAMFAGILGFFHYVSDKRCRNPSKIPNKSLVYIFLLALSVYAFNITFTKSIFYASDVTWPVIMISLSAIFIYLYSSLYFEDSPDFDWMILVGISLTVIGLGIISIYFKD